MINLTCFIAVTAANPKPQMAAPAAIDGYVPAPKTQSPAPKTTHAMKTTDVVKARHRWTTRDAQRFLASVITPNSANTAAIFSGVAFVRRISKGPANAMTTYGPAASKVVISRSNTSARLRPTARHVAKMTGAPLSPFGNPASNAR
jgi:predicted P-loop ATPase